MRQLVFVYNADSGPAALLVDFVHRIVSPSTYACNLCDLTYGYFTMKPVWKAFIASLPLPVRFVLRDAFVGAHPEHAGTPFPAAFVVSDGGPPRQLIPAAELNAARDLESLRQLVARKVAELPAS
jgi:hypothetical protein